MDDLTSKARRSTAYPEELFLYHIDSEESSSAATTSVSHSSLKHGTFESKEDPQLHSLPQDLYTHLQGHVTTIKVSHCPLRYIGHNVAGEGVPKNISISFFYRLTELRIIHCKLTDLPNGFEDLGLLKVIDVSFNALRSLPESLGFAPFLQELYSTNNLLSNPLPSSLLHSKTLKILHLHNNDLVPTDFPIADIKSTLALKHLVVDEQATQGTLSPLPLRNKSLFKSAGKLEIHSKKEHVAILQRQSQTSAFDLLPPNTDRKVDFSPRVTTHYRWLSLEGSDCSYTDECHFGPTEILIGSFDHLSLLPMTSLSKVSQIIIEDEPRILDLLPRLQNLPNMRTLVLKRCGIKELPDNFFKQLVSLKYLDLSENLLRFIPPSFSGASSLRFCILDKNNISAFPELPKNLLSLHINQNCLCIDNDPKQPTNTISLKQFAYARSLVVLEMQDNCILSEDFFPGNYLYPTQLSFKKLIIDARAVRTSDNSYRTTLKMQDGCSPSYVIDPSKEWQERMLKEMKFFTRGSLGKQKIGLPPL